LGLHWLFGDGDDPSPERLSGVVRGARVLNALGGPDTPVHRRLAELAPAALYSFDPRPRDGVQRHITEQWITQLEAQGLLVPKCVHQHPAHRALGVPNELRRPGGGIVLHPGSGGRAKRWPLPCFMEVARRLRREEQRAIRFVVGHVEQETWPADELATLADEFPLVRAPSPEELVTLLAAADAFVGNDAGPTHLAALLGTPTVAIFGPTSPSIWRPLGPSVRVFAGDPAAKPDDWRIAPADVVRAVNELA
jgi:ADP-heptose:LPS heptosyltransferase